MLKPESATQAIATEKGIDISLVTGSGPGGRITSSDVENFKGAKGAAKSDVTPRLYTLNKPSRLHTLNNPQLYTLNLL